MRVMPVLTQNTTPFTTNGFTIGKAYEVIRTVYNVHTVLNNHGHARYISLDCPSPHIKGYTAKQREACIGMFIDVSEEQADVPRNETLPPQVSMPIFDYDIVWTVPQPDTDTTLWKKQDWLNWCLSHRPEDYNQSCSDKHAWKRYQDKKRQESYDKVVQDRVTVLRGMWSPPQWYFPIK